MGTRTYFNWVLQAGKVISCKGDYALDLVKIFGWFYIVSE